MVLYTFPANGGNFRGPRRLHDPGCFSPSRRASVGQTTLAHHSLSIRSLPLTLRRIGTALLVAAISACGSEQAVQFTGSEPPEPASARLIWRGVDVTAHVALNAGEMEQMELRLFAANGTRITGYDDHFTVTLTFTPASLAEVSSVDGMPLLKTMVTSTQQGLGGDLMVTWRHEHTDKSGTLGPFEVLVH
jgi:hypothetical protein